MAVAQILEAMVVGVIVMGATFAVMSLDAPPPSTSNPASEETESKLYSGLSSFDDIYIANESYSNSALSRAVANAIAGQEEELVQSIEALLPPSGEFCAYLNNGNDRMTLHCPSQPSGPTVGVSYPFEPGWQQHFGETTLRVYQEDANTQMGITLAPMLYSQATEDPGVYMQAEFEGTQTWLPGLKLDQTTTTDFSETAYSTLVQGDDTTDYPSAAVYMECGRNDKEVPCYAMDLTANTTAGPSANGYEPTAKTNATGNVTGTVSTTSVDHSIDADVKKGHRINLVVENSGPGAVPAGTLLEAQFPVGIDVNDAGVLDPNSNFRNVRVVGEDPQPETVRAKLDADLAENDEVELRVWVNRTDTRYAYKQVDVTLSNGAVSSSQFLLLTQDKAKGTYTGGDTRVPLVSGPKPSGSLNGSDNPEGRWAVVLPTPYGEHEIDRFNFTVDSGREIITGAAWPDDFKPAWPSKTVRDGTLSNSSTQVAWRHNSGLSVPGYTFVEYQFNVETDGTLTRASPDFPVHRPQVLFDEYDAPGQSIQTEPGLWWREYPPDDATQCLTDVCPGFENDFGGLDTYTSHGTERATVKLDTHLESRDRNLNGSVHYEVADLSDTDELTQGEVKDAIDATHVSTDRHRVSPGETVTVHVDSNDIQTYLSRQIGLSSMSMESKVFAPWGVLNMTPAQTIEHDAVSGALKAPNDIMAGYVNADSSQDAIVASDDGNVYALSGNNGATVAGHSFDVPKGPVPDASDPTILERSRDNNGNEVIAVGTAVGTKHFHVVDGELSERWTGIKPGETKNTLGLNTSIDVTGDNVPDVVVSTDANDVTTTETYSKNKSQLSLWNGADTDGDGEGNLVPGWGWNISVKAEESATDEIETHKKLMLRGLGSAAPDATIGAKAKDGIVIPGRATQVGMGNVGYHGTSGVYANTGRQVSTNAMSVVKKSAKDLMEDGTNPDGSIFSDTITISEAGTGLVGFTRGGQHAFNLTGLDARETLNADRITEGDKWSGIAVAGGNGWIWGLNASQPIFPVTGWTNPAGTRPFTDVSMANKLEGYKVAPDGYLLYTRNGWANVHDTSATLGMKAVDTPDGAIYGEAAETAWWAGEAGAVMRSTENLNKTQPLTTTGTLAGLLELDGSNTIDRTLKSLTTYDLTDINFTDVEAVSEKEAWFVGEGIDGTSAENRGFIVHTTDNGTTLNVVEVDCGSTDCGLTGIDENSHQTWVSGRNGLVMVRDDRSSAARTSMDAKPDIDRHGRLSIPLNTEGSVSIDNMTVTWDPTLTLSVMEAAHLDDAGTDQDLWNATKGCPDYTEEKLLNCDSDYGAGHGNPLRVAAYVNDSNEDDNRTLNDQGTLTAGPFANIDLDTNLELEDPYFNQSWYNDSSNLPLTFYVNVTFADGSDDTYTVRINDDGSITSSEASTYWSYASKYSEASFTTPSCFGPPDASCADHLSVNVTNLGTDANPKFAGLVTGEPGSNDHALYRMLAGSQTWEAVDTTGVDILRDGAISPTDPDRWVAVGGTDQTQGGNVYVSKDAGRNWTLVPVNPVVTIKQPHYAVDATDPKITYIVGGGDEGYLSNALGGHAAHGVEPTVDIYNETLHSGTELAAINMTSPPEILGGSTGTTPVEIDVWDETLDGGEGAWASLYDSHKSGPYTYEFNGTATDIRLRFEMASNGTRRYSSTVSGTTSLAGIDDTSDSWDNPDVTFDFSLDNAVSENKFDTPIDELEYNANLGYLRLPAYDNPWLYRLGNSDEGPWGTVGDGSVGARPVDMDLSPDGHTLWVATGGIYSHGADATTGPITKCGSGSDQCYDNTLYAINVTTGGLDNSWDPVRFDRVPQHVHAEENNVTVVAADDATVLDSTAGVNVTRISTSDSSVYTNNILSLSNPTNPALADAFVGNSETGDLFLGARDDTTQDGRVYALKSPGMKIQWQKNPAMKGVFEFDYDVPRSAAYGTHVVSTNISWSVDTAEGSLVQSSKLHSLFTVTPDDRRQPVKPTYSLEIVAWMQGRS